MKKMDFPFNTIKPQTQARVTALVYLMFYSSQYIKNIGIMADSVVLSVEIIIGISMEITSLSAMIQMFSMY